MVKIYVQPVTSDYSSPLSISVSDLKPSTMVHLLLETQDVQGKTWQSRALFKSDRSGVVDVNTAQPYKGYKKPDVKGLLRHLKAQKGSRLRPGQDLERVVFTLRVEMGEHVLAETRFSMLYAKAGIDKIPLESPLVGMYYVPRKPHSGLAMICLGGSSGRPPYLNAGLLASQGHPAVALSYFSGKGQSKRCVEVSVDTVLSARDWLLQQEGVTSVGVMGCSKGAELALIAAGYAALDPIVLVSPSAYVFQGLGAASREVKSSWTYKGASLPCLPVPMTPLKTAAFVARMMLRRPQRFVTLYEQAIANAEPDVARAAKIPLDALSDRHIALFSGGDDAVWPASYMAELIKENAPDSAKITDHVFDGVGHLVTDVLPYFPATPYAGAGKGILLDFGGDLERNTEANITMWSKILDHMKAHSGA